MEGLFASAGQLFAGTGAGTGELLAKGSANQVLTVGGADPSGLEWTSPAPGGVTSFNTRTGAVVPASGDYTVGEVTGAAPTVSPTFTGTPIAPTAAPMTDDTQIATTAYVDAAVSASTADPVLYLSATYR